MAITTATAVELVRAWERMQVHYVPHWLARWEMLLADLASALGHRPARVLDIGCGTGPLSWRLAQRFPHATVLGVDADDTLIQIARAGHPPLPTLHFEAMWAEDLAARPEEARTYDAIVSSAVVHYLDSASLQRHLDAMGTLLTPGGLALHVDTHLELGGDASRGSYADANPWCEWWETAARTDICPDLVSVSPMPSRSDEDGQAPRRPVTHSSYCVAALATGFTRAEHRPLTEHDVLFTLVR